MDNKKRKNRGAAEEVPKKASQRVTRGSSRSEVPAQEQPAQEQPAPPAPVPAAKGRGRPSRKVGLASTPTAAVPDTNDSEAAGPSNSAALVAPATSLLPSSAAAAPVPAPVAQTLPVVKQEPGAQGKGMATKQTTAAGEDEDAGDVFGRNFSHASSALQGLLRKLGAGGFEELLPGGISGGRLKTIITALRQVDDEAAQLTALNELCEMLSISTEDTLASFPAESVVPLLVSLLNTEHNPDMMLLAARALTFMADVLPTSCAAIVRHGAVPAFCARLLTIEYIDLAEQSLQALEKLSHEHAHSLLSNGGLLAVLSYLDFFPTGVQRVATATAANMCRGLTSEHVDAVKEAIPCLAGLLHYSDAKVVDNACMALSHIADSYSTQQSLLQALSGGGLMNQALQLISISESGSMTSQLSLATYYGLVKLLATCAASSAVVSQSLLEAGVLDTVLSLLSTSTMLFTTASSASVLRTAAQLHEVVALLHHLLPSVPDASVMVLEGLPALPPSGAAASGSTGADPRTSFLLKQPLLVKRLCVDLLPLLLQVHSATVMQQVRQCCLTVIVRIIYAAPVAQLEEHLKELPLSAFIASLLPSRDTAVAATALQLAEALMGKLPGIFRPQFLKEGVMHAMDQLSQPPPAPAPVAARPAAAAAGAPAAPVAAVSAAAAPNAAVSLATARSAAAALTAAAASASASMSAALAAAQAAAAKQAAAALAPVAGPTRGTRSSSRLLGSDKKEEKSGSSTDAAAAAVPTAAPIAPAPKRASPAPAALPPVTAAAVPSSAAAVMSAMAAATASAAAAVAAVAASRPAPAVVASTTLALRTGLSARAKRFREEFYGKDAVAGDNLLLTSGLMTLKHLADSLVGDKTQVSHLFQLLAAPDSSANSVSTFELLSSGLVKTLIDFLQGTDLATAVGSSSTGGKQELLLSRLLEFAEVALAVDETGSQPPLLPLVRKLQSALSSLETFPVMCSRMANQPGSGSRGATSARGSSQASASNPGSLRSGLVALTQPFKLRLCKHGADRALREYSSNIVLIEPLATMAAIEEFLWPRVARGAGAGEVPGAGGVGSRSAADIAAIAAAVASARAAAATAAAEAASRAAAAAAATRGGRKASGRAAPQPEAPVPAAPAPERRMTRAAAAKAAAELARSDALPVPKTGSSSAACAYTVSGRRGAAAAAAAAVHAPEEDDDSSDGDHDEEEEDEDVLDADGDMGMAAMAAHGGVDGGEGEEGEEHEAMFDEDDDDFDDGMDGEDGAELGLGQLQVHDLHMEVDPAAAPEGSAGSAAALLAASAATTASALASLVGADAAATIAAAALASASTGGVAPPTGRLPAWGSHSAAGGVAAGSAAAAAAAAAAATAAAAARAPPPPKLSFYIHSIRLTSSTTVFQAIQQSLGGASGEEEGGEGEEGDEGGAGGRGGRGRRLWEDVHTLHYRTYDAAVADAPDAATGSSAPAAAAAGADASSSNGVAAITVGGNGDAVVGPWVASPLWELLGLALPEDLVGSSECKEVLQLLQLLEAVNRLGGRLSQAASTGRVSMPLPTVHAICLDASILTSHTSNGNKASGSSSNVASTSSKSKAGRKQSERQVQRQVSREEFVSCKLGSKLSQQLKDVLSICGGGLPGWCKALTGSAKFLFPLEIRRRYFYCTAFGLGRALQHMQALHSTEAGATPASASDGRDVRLGRVPRQKVRVSRKRVLESATKVMELYSKHRSVLEIEYFGEAGTGLGPTLEFYTLLSHDLQKSSLDMWRHERVEELHDVTANAGSQAARASPMDIDSKSQEQGVAGASTSAAAGQAPASGAMHAEAWHESGEFVNAPFGLFPQPLGAKQRLEPNNQVVSHFKLLGRTVGKALQDSRLLDLPLNHVFYRGALGKQVDIQDIARFDPGLGASMERLASSLAQHRASKSVGSVMVDGVAIEDLCLTFTVPGYPDYTLHPDGADVVVDGSNLGEYIDAVVDATLGEGVKHQLAAFREGFNEVFPLRSLECFFEDEIEAMLCGSGESWTVQSLSDGIKFDHGYTLASSPVKCFLEVLSELNGEDQKRFLRFVTGCPRLPMGGIAALRPRLTVVRKHPSGVPSGAELLGSSNGTPVGSLSGVPPSGQSSNNLNSGTTAADGDLPSVMTCANYIKLPPYSCKEIMAERLLYAIREGQGSFDLS